MSGKICHPGWLALIFVLFAAQAFGQFEVSPDHFDDTAATSAHKTQHKKTARQPALLNSKLKQWPKAGNQAGAMCSEDTEDYLICSAL